MPQVSVMSHQYLGTSSQAGELSALAITRGDRVTREGVRQSAWGLWSSSGMSECSHARPSTFAHSRGASGGAMGHGGAQSLAT